MRDIWLLKNKNALTDFVCNLTLFKNGLIPENMISFLYSLQIGHQRERRFINIHISINGQRTQS